MHVIIITLKTTALKTFNFVCPDTSPRMLGEAIVVLQKVQGHTAAIVLELSQNVVPLETL